jgi:hypothetical protein
MSLRHTLNNENALGGLRSAVGGRIFQAGSDAN